MSNLVVADPGALDKSAFQPKDTDEAIALAEKIAISGIAPKALQKKPEDILIVMLTGRELGMSVMQSLREIHVINGKPQVSSQMMTALVMSSPVCEFLRVTESSIEGVTYETKRAGNDPFSMTFTMKDAQQAGLSGSAMYKQYPATMLQWRCASMICRTVYPDVIGGVYVTGEVPPEVEAVDAPAQPAPDPTASKSDQLADSLVIPEPEDTSFEVLNPDPQTINKDQERKILDTAIERASGEFPDATKSEIEKRAGEIVKATLAVCGYRKRSEIPVSHFVKVLEEIEIVAMN